MWLYYSSYHFACLIGIQYAVCKNKKKKNQTNQTPQKSHTNQKPKPPPHKKTQPINPKPVYAQKILQKI